MQKLAIDPKHGITGWYCTRLHLYNDILTIQCGYCNELRDEYLAVVAFQVKCKRDGTLNEIKQWQHLTSSN